jgi:hypothetical protein
MNSPMKTGQSARLVRKLNAVALEPAIWAVNLVLVFLICRYLFGMNSLGIFFGWDPTSMLAFLGERHRFSDILFGLGSDPIIGLGNISYPVNQNWFPSFVFAKDQAGTFDGPLAFAIGATELFAATVLCGRLSGFALAPSVAAGWLVTLTTWQLFGMPTIVTIWFFFPNHAEVLAVLTVMVAATLHLGRGPVWRSALLASVIFVGLTHTLLAIPTSLVLTLPILGMFTFAKLLLSIGRREVLTIILCWVGIGSAALALGYVHYLGGLLAYTAAGFFPDLSKRTLTLYSGQVTLLLWTPVSSISAAVIFTPERMMVAGGLFGSVAAIWLGSQRQRELALGVILAETVLIALGVSNYWLDYWFGPSIWYFESYLFPYFALYITFLLLAPLMLVWRAISSAFQGQIASWANAVAGFALPLAIGLYARAIGPAVQTASRENPAFFFASPLPQPESVITRILKSELKLSPDHQFRGRVAVMTGRIFPEKHEWQHYSLVHYFALFATGNLHDGPGLWQDDVPTLMESNTLMTPASFVFLRALLTDPADSQIRTIVGMRRIDPRILKAIGVRFVITDLPISGAALRAQIPIPVSPKAREMLGFSYRELDGFDLYLYEFDGVNLGQFSPTEPRLARDANQVLGHLADGKTNLDRTIVIGEPLSGPLTEAKLELFTIGRDQYRVRASSAGKSILLLPVEFSRCLTIFDAAGGAPRLLRADLMLTGILFERQIDAQISFHTGPFYNSRCRLDDLTDSKLMEMRNAFRDRPAFGVLRPH